MAVPPVDGPPPEAPMATLPPLPTQQCPHCSNTTPAGNYCGVCGAHLVHPDEKLAARRPHAFMANPDEPILRLSVASTLFPHLSHRSSVPFRAGFALLVGLLVLFSATDLEAPVIALSAMGLPLLFQLYIYEVDVYEDNHVRLAAVTLLVGAALGVAWALLGGHIVSHALQPTLGSSLGGGDVINAAVTVPVVGQALMLVPLLLVLVMMPGFGGRRESLDGFALGAASALGFSFAAIITDLASRLSAGVVTARPFTSILTEALIRGIATPVLFAAATGLIGASLWVRRSERGSVNASGRWLTNPPLILAGFLLLEIGLGFADQARLADIPLLAIHLAGAAVALLALRVGIHHILLHEQHDIVVGPSVTCAHCHHIVPQMPFCPSCGVAMVATSKRHRPTVLTGDTTPTTGDSSDDAPAAESEPGWPTLEVGATSSEWSGYPLAAASVTRAHRSHHAYLLGIFLCGLLAITVALVLTAVTKAPDKTPVQRCHNGLCPGTVGAVGYTGALEGPPAQVFKSSDGRFSVALFTSGLYPTPALGPTNSGLVSLIYKNSTARASNGTVNLAGGEVQVADVSGLSAGATAQQIVDAIVSKNASSASLAYPLPDALVGDTPGYGAVYTDNINSSSGTQVTYRIVVMAAIRNGVAIAVWLEGPDDTSFPSLPFLDHPSFIDLDIAIGGVIDLMVNSIQWRSSTLGP
jgi:RsiW-degrading membrane proteinase PrsW (M82 family)